MSHSGCLLSDSLSSVNFFKTEDSLDILFSSKTVVFQIFSYFSVDVCVSFNKEFDAPSALPPPLPLRENQVAKVKQAGGKYAVLIQLYLFSNF